MLAQKPPPCTGLAGTPLPFKVPVLKASTKNPGLTPLTPPLHGHSNLKVEPQTETPATWRASAKRAQKRPTPPPTSSRGLTPRSEASAKHKEQPDLPEPEAAKSPSRSPKCCKPTQWRQLNHKGILAEESSTPKSNNGGPHENARRPRAPGRQECYKPKATCPRPALVLPEPQCSSRSAC